MYVCMYAYALVENGGAALSTFVFAVEMEKFARSFLMPLARWHQVGRLLSRRVAITLTHLRRTAWARS